MFRKVLSIVLAITLSVSLFACGGNNTNGSFKVVDGKEIYMEGDNQVIDKLVEVGGDKYYVAEDGTKVKNDWAVIDNDGNYAYFGAKGQMIKDQIKEINGKKYLFKEDGVLQNEGNVEYKGDKYCVDSDGSLLCDAIVTVDGKDVYFGNDGKQENKTGWVENKSGELPVGFYFLDENGQRKVGTWEEEYYLDNIGKMAVNQWVGEYYVGQDGAYLKNTTTPDGKKVGADGKMILQAVTEVVKAIDSISNAKSTLTDSINKSISDTVLDVINANVENNDEKELYVDGREMIEDYYELNWEVPEPDEAYKYPANTESVEEERNEEYEKFSKISVEKCKILIAKPKINGKDENIVNNANKLITDLIDQYLEKIKSEDVLVRRTNMGYGFTSNTAVESITLSNVEEINNIDKVFKGKEYVERYFSIILDGQFIKTDGNRHSTDSYKVIIEYDKKDNVAKLKEDVGYSKVLNGEELVAY